MAKNMAGWIRSLEGNGGVYIADADQKKLWQWFDEISPEERLEWYKRILKLPFSRPSFANLNLVTSYQLPSWKSSPTFFAARKMFTEMAISKDRPKVLDDLRSNILILAPFPTLVWDIASPRSTRGPTYIHGRFQGGSGQGQAYVFAMSFLDILAPILQGNLDLQEWLHSTPTRNTSGYILPNPVLKYLSRKTPLAAHIYQSIIRQCVPYRNMEQVETFFTPE